MAAYIYSGGGDKVKETQLRDTAEKAKVAHEQQIKEEAAVYEANIEVAKESLKNADTASKAQVKYQHQIDYMKQLASSRDKWGATANLGAVGAAGIIQIIPGVGLIGGAATIGASAKSAESAYLLKEAQKEYGIDGVKKMKKESRLKNKREAAEADKDLDEDDKSDDKKDDKK